MLYSFFLHLTKMLGVAQPFGFATPTFIIEPKNTGPPDGDPVLIHRIKPLECKGFACIPSLMGRDKSMYLSSDWYI